MPYDIIRRKRRYCVRNSETGEIKHCYDTKEKALRLLRALYANVDDARAESEERDAVFKAYHALVNMSASELEQWAESECSKKASLSRAPIQRNLHLLRTPKEQWGAKEIRWAKRTISFISRMRAMPRGEPQGDCPSKRDIALRNWGYNPSAERADVRAWRPEPVVACVRTSVEDVKDPSEIDVLAMPFFVVDSFQTYFSPRTDLMLDYLPSNVPVFDWHGLGGRPEDARPIGRVVRWWTTSEGRWARVKLNTDDPRYEQFARAAAECRLGASVGMLRAGMYPQPPVETNGVFDKPTELLQAPVVELSLIIMDETKRPSNPSAIAGYRFDIRYNPQEDMCDCQQEMRQMADVQALEELRAQIETLRQQMATMEDELQRERKAKEELIQMRRQERADQFAQRMIALKMPRDVIDSFLNIYNKLEDRDQDELNVALARLLDYVRGSAATEQAAALRSADSVRAMLTSQVVREEKRADDLDRFRAEVREWLAKVRRTEQK